MRVPLSSGLGALSVLLGHEEKDAFVGRDVGLIAGVRDGLKPPYRSDLKAPWLDAFDHHELQDLLSAYKRCFDEACIASDPITRTSL